jgi:alkylation response protein AidB-like acyl-CoA dehydrogenase
MTDTAASELTLQRIRNDVRDLIAEESRASNSWSRCDAWLTGYDPDFSRKLAGRGLVGVTWPKRFGGRDLTQIERYTVLEELLAGGAPVAAHWIADRQTGPLLLRYGTDEQRTRFLPAIANGECFFSIGMSEPDSGSDLASVRVTAARVAGGWTLHGTKLWTSHAHRNHFMVTLVRTEPGLADKHAGLSQLIVDLRAKDVVVRPIRLMSGEPHFSEVVFDGTFVPDAMLVGREGDGWQQVTSELAYERSGPERFLSTFPLLAELARIISSSPDDHRLQALGELTARLWSLRALSLSVAGQLQAGEEPMSAACMLKCLGTAFEGDVVESARLLVPPGQRSDRFDRLLKGAITSVPGFTLRGGTTEILRTIVARSLSAQGPGSSYQGIDPEVADLLLDTATAVFGRKGGTSAAAIEQSGLAMVGAEGLPASGVAVRAAAYFGESEPFAENVFRPGSPSSELGALMTSVQIGGAMARVRDLTVEYARDRHQFGQPLNRFQAVQHHLANLAMEARVADIMIATTLAKPHREQIAATKVVAGRAASRVAAAAHQVHGAIGMTEEHSLHRFTTALWRWRDVYRTEAEWALELGRFIADRDLWEETAA